MFTRFKLCQRGKNNDKIFWRTAEVITQLSNVLRENVSSKNETKNVFYAQ